MERKSLRSLPDELAEDVFHNADGHYYDTATDVLIAAKRAIFKGVERDIVLVYSKADDTVTFITMHPLREGQRQRRVESMRG